MVVLHNQPWNFILCILKLDKLVEVNLCEQTRPFDETIIPTLPTYLPTYLPYLFYSSQSPPCRPQRGLSSEAKPINPKQYLKRQTDLSFLSGRYMWRIGFKEYFKQLSFVCFCFPALPSPRAPPCPSHTHTLTHLLPIFSARDGMPCA